MYQFVLNFKRYVVRQLSLIKLNVKKLEEKKDSDLRNYGQPLSVTTNNEFSY